MTRARAFPFGACAVWLLSAAPFALPAAWFEGSSRAALAALPWLAWAGLPRRRMAANESANEGAIENTTTAANGEARANLALALALAAPVVAAGAWIDRAHGVAGSALAVQIVACAALALVGAAAAHAARSAARAHRVHVGSWIALVAGPPVLVGALTLGGASTFGPAPAVLRAWARASPLQFGVEALDFDTLAPGARHELPWVALAATVAIWLLVRALARRDAAATTRSVASLVSAWLVPGLTVCTWCAASGSASAFAPQNRAVFADVEIHGPTSGVVLEVGSLGSTRLEGALRAGETRRMSVPVPLASDGARVEPLVRLEGAAGDLEGEGRARFLGWRGGASPLAELSPAVRVRARPAVAAPHVSVSRAVPLVLVIACVVAVFARRRPALALASGLIGAAATWPLVRADATDLDRNVVLFDGEAGASAWRRVDAAADEIVVPESVVEFELWTEPPAAGVTWVVPLDPRGAWRARASGARLFLASTVFLDENALTREANGFGPLSSTWVRDGGEWHAHGSLPFGAPLGPRVAPDATSTTPGVLPTTPMPPGWLLAGLPQGIGLLVGRLTPGSADEGATPGRAAGPSGVGAWLRLTGF